MKNVNIETQGVRGAAVKRSKVGLMNVHLDNALLFSVDNFHGSGGGYKQREEPIIIIYDGFNPPNEVIMFEGTHAQLVDLLSKAQ